MQGTKKKGVAVGPQGKMPGNKRKLHKPPTNPKQKPQKRRRNR